MNIFFDSSVLCKYFIEEEGTPEVQQFVADASEKQGVFLSVSAVTYAEIMAALRRASHENRIEDSDFMGVVEDFRQQWRKLYVVSVSLALIEKSGELGLNYTLKGCDAFQLASALMIGADLFVSSDDDLNNVAVQMGMTVWNPLIDTVPQISVLNI
ncbi:MAG: type II toxin-antitoxin system VapC family toxin [Desulfobacterales bacterium]|nr:type II toxin-antitoxin system VapC family toxin [Desulfobacterales bacterium]